MNIKEIVKDSLKYPLSNWKNYLILGIIAVIIEIYTIVPFLGVKNITAIYFLYIIGLIIDFLVLGGYQFKIIQSSLAGVAESPEFNAWIDMAINGFKVFIVDVVYSIPVILIVIVFAGVSIISIPWSIDLNIGNSFLLSEMALIGLFIALLYKIIMFPISRMAIAYMIDNDGKLSAAFRLKEIFNKIGNIGWINLIKWYIVTDIIYTILMIVGSFIILAIGILIYHIVNNIIPFVTGAVLVLLIIYPYIRMYLYRSVALIYKSEK
jgi:hypothetical protein